MKGGLQENEPSVAHAPFASSGPYDGHRFSMAHLSRSIKKVYFGTVPLRLVTWSRPCE